MNTWVAAASHYFEHSAYPAALIEVLVESLVILVVAAVWCLAWRRAAAATRHLIWFLAVASLPILLCLSTVPHSWLKPLWSASTQFESGNQVSLLLALSPGANPADSFPSSAGIMDYALSHQADSANDRPLAARISASWLILAFIIWAAGAALGLVSLLAGQVQLRQLARKAKPIGGPDWAQFVLEAREILRLRRCPKLLQAADNTMPLTWGSWRPVVLLPAEAAHWPPQRRQIVFLHELAHVKRWDCLTQTVARLVCSLFWINPLVWLAARRMCIERERACDDLVLNGGSKSSEYAAQLLEVARAFRHVPFTAGIAMARSPRLRHRIAAIVDGSRKRRLRPEAAIAIFAIMSALVVGVAGTASKAAQETSGNSALRQQQMALLEAFSKAKEKQSQALAASAGEAIAPDFRRFFDAAVKGDFQTVTSRYAYFKHHHPQYQTGTNAVIDSLRTPYWSPVLEICLAYDHVANCDPKYTKILADGIINSVPPGSIYFGGTDPGRGVPTAFEKSSIEGDPFFCLTQNALGDGTYLDYLRAMYGGKIYIPTTEDSQHSFQDYLAGASRRLNENKLKPGEDVRVVDNRVQVSGQVAVISIDALIARIIFDRNPDREFYLEESFPLDWMYPHLQPHDLIMKIARQPQPQLPAEALARDHEYWRRLVAGMIGNWLSDDTPVSDVASFVNRVYVHKDLSGFAGDSLFIHNDYAKRIFSKLRSSIAGIYAWRLGTNTPAEFTPKTDAERQALIHEADLAFRQAFVLCPYSPEALFRYENFLMQFNRLSDGLLLAQASVGADPQNGQARDLLQKLHEAKQ